jgi:hypothetical protein
MEKTRLPRHLLRVEWQLLHMVGNFEHAIQRPEVVQLLESSARARETRDLRRAPDAKLRACGGLDN